MYAEERQQALLDAARQHGRVVVAEGAAQYGVTAETIRRDLGVLEGLGLVRRVHGGAIPADALDFVERGLPDREITRADEKKRIARAALPHLPRGASATLLLDAGTSVARLAAILPPDPELTVLTNSVPIAGMVRQRLPGPVHMIGGRLRGLTQATVGVEAVKTIERLRVGVAVLGTNGITAAHGCSTPHPEEGAVKHAMVGAARRVIVVADSSKVGVEHL
ncbi:MAG: DeoR/GlpR family DNA-binding transcription regulator, partial [Dermatophilaceae bacterium]